MNVHEIELPEADFGESFELERIAEDALKADKFGPLSLCVWQLLATEPDSVIGKIFLKKVLRDPRGQAVSPQALKQLVAKLKLEHNDTGLMMLLSPRLLTKANDVYAVTEFVVAAIRAERPDIALRAAHAGASLSPKDPRMIELLGRALMAAERYDDASLVFSEYVELRGGIAQPRVQLAEALIQAGRSTDAANVIESALTKFPMDQALLRLQSEVQGSGVQLSDGETSTPLAAATAALKSKDYAEALLKTREAFALDGGNAELKFALSNLEFLNGNYKEGAAIYPARFESEPELRWLKTDIPAYTGQPLDGMRLLVWADQGLGDEILFAQVLELMGTQAGDITAAVDKRLIPQFAKRFPDLNFIERQSEAISNDFDYQIALGDLFFMHWEQHRSMPSDAIHPVLSPDPKLVAKFKAEYKSDGPLIGISWRGGQGLVAQYRSIPVDAFVSAAPSNARLVNLQYGAESAEASSVASASILETPFDNTLDLESLIAMMAACDAVITVDNATAHLACAAGVETHVLVPGRTPDFRWKNAEFREACFPTAKVHVPAVAEDWSSVLAEVWGYYS